MEALYLYLENEVLKARRLEPYEKLKSPLTWKDLQFEFTTSSLMMINWPILLPELPPKVARSFLDLVGARYPFSPHHDKLKELCPQLLFTRDSDEWVFFGGSFNPWHKGHQACLNLLPEDKLCFILPDRNPFKELRTLEPVSTIIELVKNIKFGKNHFIAPSFLVEFQKNPTISWIEKLKKDFPNKRLSLLLGFDSFTGIKNWVRAEDLLKCLDTIYVTSRLEDDEEREKISAPIKAMANQIKIDFLGRHEFEELSSTKLRNQK